MIATATAETNGHSKAPRTEVPVLMIPIDDIQPSPMNPRKGVVADPEMQAALKEKGLLVPLLVREMKGGKGKNFELVFGERRWKALKENEETHVRCEVRDLTDDQALELMLIEYVHREDLEPMEEAEAFGALRDKLGIGAGEIAVRVSKHPTQVYQRLKLLSLCPAARAALNERTLKTGAAMQLSRLEDHGAQVKLLPQLVARKTPMGMSPGADEAVARQMVLGEMRVLARAPFDREANDLVVAAGACTQCPKRSNAQGALFGEDAGDDRCTDEKCWGSKIKAHGAKVLAEAKAKGLPVLNNLPTGTWEHSGDRISINAPFVDVADSTNIGGKVKTWKDVLKGSGVEAHVAVSPNGETHELADKKKAEAVAKKLQPPRASSGGASTRSSGGSSKSDDQLVEQAQHSAVLVAIVEKGEKASAAKVLRVVIGDLLESKYEGKNRIAQRRGFKGPPEKAIEAFVEKARIEQLQGFVLELLAEDPYDDERRNTVGEALGIDVSALLTKAEKSITEAKAKPTPAAAAAKPATKKAPAKKTNTKNGAKKK